MGRTKLKVTLLAASPEPEKIIAMAAKLCYAAGEAEALRDAIENKDQGKFIDKLVDMGHLSPIEHASFTFLVQGVSRSLLAQVTRHRLASFSVRSQRYVNHSSHDGEVFPYVIPPQIIELGPEYIEKYETQMAQMQEWYDEWVKALGKKGETSNEDARFVLPNAAETKFILTMNARELQHFFHLRCCQRAQWEIRAMATEMLSLVREAAPNLFAVAGPGCLSGPCPEGSMSCGKQVQVREYFQKIGK